MNGLQPVVYSINGPVITVEGATGFQMMEMVYVGEKRLIGEVINISSSRTTIQVYEVTTGLHPGEPVSGTGGPLCATLGPGILSNIFDGIERPLDVIAKQSAHSSPRAATSRPSILKNSGKPPSGSGRATRSRVGTSTPPARKPQSSRTAPSVRPA